TDGMGYLHKRGITNETISKFKLGLKHEGGKKWLAIPHLANGHVANFKYRSLDPENKAYKREPGCQSILFNGDIFNDTPEVIYITEGELDAITLIQAGIKNTVSGTAGAGHFDPDWIDQLKDIEKIVLVYDPDEAGRNGARSVAKRLGYERCKYIELPTDHDVNAFFCNGGDKEAFLALKEREFDLPGITSVDSAIEMLIRDKTEKREESIIKTPWPDVNERVGGWRPGDLIILSAPPKTGKTSWALNVSGSLAFQGIPSLFFCVEMRPERLADKLIEYKYRQAQLTAQDMMKANEEFSGLPLYFAYSFKKQSVDQVIDLIREAVKRYDLKFVVFDNIHFLVRSTMNTNEELAQAIQAFKLLAEEMEIPIMVIAQPRKGEFGGRKGIMDAEDIKGSSAFHSDCDQMILLHRKKVDSNAKNLDNNDFSSVAEVLMPQTLVRVEAHRYGPGGDALLYFHGEYSRFDTVTKRPEMSIVSYAL
ncbi:MAG: AAA family ATPase, partial [Methanosarcinales archaeon]|nr:AAA family ATPase [Methanosarcinales archaeon]